MFREIAQKAGNLLSAKPPDGGYNYVPQGLETPHSKQVWFGIHDVVTGYHVDAPIKPGITSGDHATRIQLLGILYNRSNPDYRDQPVDTRLIQTLSQIIQDVRGANSFSMKGETEEWFNNQFEAVKDYMGKKFPALDTNEILPEHIIGSMQLQTVAKLEQAVKV